MFPPGPFPPHGVEELGQVDLGIRVRDLFFRRDLIVGPVRRALVEHLQAAASVPGRLAMATSTIEALLDTWPLASLIEDAVHEWVDGPNPVSLAVMARCAEVVAPAVGWPLSIDRRWPMPDEAWIRSSAGEGPFVVVGRAPRDAAPAVAVSLDAPLGEAEALDLPKVLTVSGDELVTQLDTLVGALESGSAAAIQFDTPVPWDDASRAALETLREYSDLQQSYEKYGQAALETGPAPAWKDLLQDAPPGRPSDTPARCCDAVVLPMLDAQGKPETVGCLVWEAPFKAVTINPAGVEVLRHMDGQTTAQAIAEKVNSTEENIAGVMAQLVRLGAASG